MLKLSKENPYKKSLVTLMGKVVEIDDIKESSLKDVEVNFIIFNHNGDVDIIYLDPPPILP